MHIFQRYPAAYRARRAEGGLRVSKAASINLARPQEEDVEHGYRARVLLPQHFLILKYRKAMYPI